VANPAARNRRVPDRLHLYPTVIGVVHFHPFNLQVLDEPEMCKASLQCRQRRVRCHREIRERDVLQHGNANHMRRVRVHRVGVEDLIVYREEASGHVHRDNLLQLAGMFGGKLHVHALIGIQQHIILGVESYCIRWRDLDRRVSPRRIRQQRPRRAVGGSAECLQCRRVPAHRAITNEDRYAHPFPLDVDITSFDLNGICDLISARLDEDLPSRRGQCISSRLQCINSRLQRREISFGGVLADYESGLVAVKRWLTDRGWRWGGQEVPPFRERDRGIAVGRNDVILLFARQ